MRANFRKWGPAVFAVVCVTLMALYIVGTSEPFENCVNESKNSEAHKALHQSSSIFVRNIVRLKLNRTCAGRFVHEDEGELTVFATFIVAFFTFTLWQSTKNLWRSSEKLWKVSEKQAATAELALINLERPYIFFGNCSPYFFRRTQEQKLYDKNATEKPRVNWTYHNVGRTPALLEELRAELYLGEVLPESREFTYSTVYPTKIVRTKEDDNISESTAFNRAITREEEIKLRDGILTFFIFGYIKYSDIIGYSHVYNFCFKIRDFGEGTGGIAETGGDAYNFNQTTKNYSHGWGPSHHSPTS